MADIKLRLAQNVPGAFYVSSDCIDCDICRMTAPTVFKLDHGIGYSVVFHQPETQVERNLAAEALAGCPVEAIGNNGVVA